MEEVQNHVQWRALVIAVVDLHFASAVLEILFLCKTDPIGLQI
jgi:hypothetical protein